MLKTCGYLVSTVSVALLGYAVWPSAEQAGLVPVLLAGMAASTVGMALRWASHVIEGRRARRQGPPDLSRRMRFEAEHGVQQDQEQQQDGLTYLARRK